MCLKSGESALSDQLVTFTFEGMDAGFQAQTGDNGCVSGVPCGMKYSVGVFALGKMVPIN